MSSVEEAKARKRRARNFERRQKAALDGIHLPSLEELLRSMSFLRGQLLADASEFAHRSLFRLHKMDGEGSVLSMTLTVLEQRPRVEDFILARDVFARQPPRGRMTQSFLNDIKMRCDFYAACMGDIRSMARTAIYAMTLARSSRTPSDEAYDYAMSALGWTSLASYIGHGPQNDHAKVHVHGSVLLEELCRERDRNLSPPDTAGANSKTNEQDAAARVQVEFGDAIAVLNAPAGDSDKRDQAIKKEFESVIDTKLPLCPVPDLRKVRAALVSEFPHAGLIIDQLLARLTTERVVKFRPLLLVGSPGSGKTTFSRKLLQVLGVKADVYSCGGVDDASLMGSPRRWSTGEASMPVLLMRRFGTASPGIILDELDKVSTGHHNGSLHDCLHGFLEPQTASAWRDPYLQMPVDLSHVLWIATANSTKRIPSTLTDRLTCISFPSPDGRHLRVLANSMIRIAFERHDLDPRWAAPIDGEEFDALSAAWTGGSLRALQRLVDAVLDARGTWSSRH